MRAPAPPYAGEREHALWHVSEDVSIERFEPRVSTTVERDAPCVLAIDTRHLPLYWFPRDCPRGTFWASPDTTPEDAEQLILGATRVHAFESGWLARMRDTRVVAYRLPDESFAPDPEVGGYWLSHEPVEPEEVVELGDLLARHAEARIELRIVESLWPLWDRVIASTVEFSGMRLRNAQPRPD